MYDCKLINQLLFWNNEDHHKDEASFPVWNTYFGDDTPEVWVRIWALWGNRRKGALWERERERLFKFGFSDTIIQWTASSVVSDHFPAVYANIHLHRWKKRNTFF